MTLGEQLAYLSHLVRLYRWRWPIVAELLLFCAVGCVGLAIDLTVLTALVELGGLWFGWARIAGFAAAVSSNFVFNDRITFAGSSDQPVTTRYARFVGTSLLGMGVNYAVSMALFLWVPPFERLYWLAAIAGVIAGTAVNFAGARGYAFRREG